MRQIIRYERPNRRPIIIGGWSKAEGVGDGGDYDYLALLADRQGRPAAEAYVAELITSLTEFNRDPAALARVRQAIAERLEAAAARP